MKLSLPPKLVENLVLSMVQRLIIVLVQVGAVKIYVAAEEGGAPAKGKRG
jgi:hypothetical protein